MTSPSPDSTSINVPHDHALVATHGVSLTTRSGLKFKVRTTEPDDMAALKVFFSRVSADDIRFRFLSPMRHVSEKVLEILIDVDHDKKESYLAFDADDKTIIASAMIAASTDPSTAEVALAVREDYKHRGLSWTLLDYLLGEARLKGFKKLQSMESRDHFDAIDLEREMGFTTKSYPGDATLLLLEKTLA